MGGWMDGWIDERQMDTCAYIYTQKERIKFERKIIMQFAHKIMKADMPFECQRTKKTGGIVQSG